MKPTAKFRLEGEDATGAAFRSALGNAQGAANKIKGVFAAAFAGVSVVGIARMAGEAISFGDEIAKAAVKAGLGARDISELAHAAAMADVELGALSGSLRKMQIAISEAASGGKSQLQTLRALGIELKDIKDLRADQQFELIAEKISRLRSEEDRARAATDLFGKSGADLLPMFERGADGIRKAREEAVQLGKSLSDDQVQALADADDAVKRLGATWQAFKTLMVAEIAPQLTSTLTALNAVMVGGAARTAHELEIAQESLARAKANGADAESIARIEAKIAEHRTKLGMPEQTRGWRRGGGRSEYLHGTPGGFEAVDADEQAAKAAEEAEKSRVKAAEEAQRERHRIYLHERDEMLRVQSHLSEGLADAIDEANDQIAHSFDLTLDEISVSVGESLQPIKSEFSVFADEAARNMQSAFADFLFDPFQNGLDGMLKGFIDVIRRMVAEAAAANIFKGMSNGGFGNFLGDLFGGFRAEGGPIQQGKWYIAGEHGPEPIWGGGPGAYAAGYGKGGGVTQNINIDARGSSVESVKLLQSSVPAIIREAVNQARAAVVSDFSRRPA